MASNDYFIDLEAKLIRMPNSRWYETAMGTFPSATTILSAKSKTGLNAWQTKIALSGIDPKEIGRKAMDEGSKVHDACERLMKGEKLSFYNTDTGEENYKLFEEWQPICRFIEAAKNHEIQPILIEQTLFSAKHQFAGTMDLLCTMKPDPKTKKRVLALIDLKRSASAFSDYHWQLSAYWKALQEMITSNAPELEDFKKMVLEKLTGYNFEDINLFLLLLNTDTKKGWRFTEVENKEEKFEYFMACNKIWRGENPNIKMVEEMYPLEISLIEEQESEVLSV